MPSPHPEKPQKPEKPLPMDCCESGCEVCVFDAYYERYLEYKQAIKEWEAQHPDAD